MHALYIVVPVLCVLAIAYRYYSAFIAARIMVLDDTRVTPAHAKYDGHNYYPTSRWVLFGHHFAAITGAGPLIGPVLAAQFGYAPGLIWLVGGVSMILAVVLGRPLANSSYAHYFLLSRNELIVALALYGFAASVLPVWMLLTPRDYLSTFMKAGTIILLVIGVIVVNPQLHMPAFSQYVGGWR